MASTLLGTDREEEQEGRQLGGQISFLEHLDELRRRLIRSIAFVFIAFFALWWVSDRIYEFLARPVHVALAEAQRRQLPLGGLTGNEQVLQLGSAQEGTTRRYVFSETT